MKTPFKSLEFIYQDTQIHFLFSQDENVMVNATDMAKAFNKRVDDFTRLESTEKYINALLKEFNHADVRDYIKSDIISSNKKRGTIMHRYLAIKFAMWLDINFEIWTIKVIDNLLFKNYNIHRQKAIEIEKTKKQIQALETKIAMSENADAIQLLQSQKQLKKLQNEKKNALLQQTKIIQLELFN